MNTLELRKRINQIVSKEDILTLFNDIRTNQNLNPFYTKKSLAFCTVARVSILKKYKQFYIPKRSGKGAREILSPIPLLNSMQHIAKYILECFYEPEPCVTGFVRNRCIRDNALPHVGNKFIYSFDLENFFSQINGFQIYDVLAKPPYNFPDIFAKFLVYLCCTDIFEQDYPNSPMEDHYKFQNLFFPQGACTSPILSNIVCAQMDKKIQILCKKNGAVYTRYADDITISFSEDSLLNRAKDKMAKKEFFHEFTSLIPFTLNKLKTRVRWIGQRQEVTGIIISENKLNVKREYIKDLRNILYIWQRYGKAKAELRFLMHYCKDREVESIPTMENYISGKLNYLKMIKGSNDSVYLKLAFKFEILKNR